MSDAIQPRRFEPDYAIPPGETIRELMADSGAPEEWVADHLFISTDDLQRLLEGRMAIDGRIARELWKIFQLPASFWLNLQANYERTKARLAAKVD